MLGQAGLYRAQNVEKRKTKPLSVREWYEKSQDKRFAGPGPNDLDPTLDRDSAALKERRKKVEAEARMKKAEAKDKRRAAAAKKGMKVEVKTEEEAINEGALETEVSSHDAPPKDESHSQPPDFTADMPPLDPSTKNSSPSTNGDSAKTPDSETDPVVDWYSHFDPSTAWLPKDTAQEDYTPEACANLERKFWKTMGLGEPSWYGADLQGTLFPDPKTKWNIAHLPNLLNRLGRELPGVNRPYLYFGMWRAVFAWHVEDVSVSRKRRHRMADSRWTCFLSTISISEHRSTGSLFPKVRLTSSNEPSRVSRIDILPCRNILIPGYFPREAKECDQFLRHKAYLMSPTRLAKDGIHVNMLVHNQGEFVITYPRGYHAGFNMGFNCAESVNFALDSWVELGRRAKVCKCVSHSVRIDMNELLGEESEFAKQQADLQAQEDIIKAFEEERVVKQRKRPSTAPDSARKRHRIQPAIYGEEEGYVVPRSGVPMPPTTVIQPPPAKRTKPAPVKALAPKAKPIPTVFPCILCPSTSTEGLLPVYQPSESAKSLCKSQDGVVRAHSVCVSSVPEVWVEEFNDRGAPYDMVMGIEGISKARWSLKCGSCSVKQLATMGAKVQCVNGKCPKAFHVTCARDDETVIHRVWEAEEYEPIPLPPGAPEGLAPEYRKVVTLKTEILCPNHNPAVKEMRKAQAARELREKVMSLSIGQVVKIKTSRGMFEAKLVKIVEDSQVAEVEHDDDHRSLVKWTELDFRSAPRHRVENEYAKDYVTRRNETGEIVQTGSARYDDAPMSARAPIAAAPRHVLPKQSSSSGAGRPMAHGAPPHLMTGHAGYPAHAPQPPRHSVYHPHAYPPSLPPLSNGSHGLLPPLMSDRRSSHPQAMYHDARVMDPRHPAHGPTPVEYRAPVYPPHAGYLPPATHARPPYSDAVPSVPVMRNDPSGRLCPPHTIPSQHHHPQAQPVYPAPSYHTTIPSQSRPPSYLPVAGTRHGEALPFPAHLSTGGPSRHASAPMTPQSLSHTSRLSSQGLARAPSSSANGSIPSVPHRSSEGAGKISLGLERMDALMKALTPLRTPAIHLAGTNGKGSVSVMLESVLRRAGLSVARYNSPHMIEPRDAMSLDGVPPSSEAYAAATVRVRQVNAELGLQATTFELATAAAYELISAHGPDVMIIECGMGGEGDATNVIPPDFILASGLTSVGLDHTAFLGDTVEKIAKVKAGIVVPGGILAIAPQQSSGVTAVASRIAKDRGASVLLAQRAEVLDGYKPVEALKDLFQPPARSVRIKTLVRGDITTKLGLAGDHQLDNAALAVVILASLGTDSRALSIQPKLSSINDAVIASGLSRATWKGRCDFVSFPTIPQNEKPIEASSMPVVVDGAHNADSATMLRRYLDSIYSPFQPKTLIIGLSDSPGKTPESVLAPLLRPGDNVIAIPFSDVEGMPWVKPVAPHVVESLAKVMVEHGQTYHRSSVRDAMSLVQDWNEKDRGLVVVCGSLYVVADFYRL